MELPRAGDKNSQLRSDYSHSIVSDARKHAWILYFCVLIIIIYRHFYRQKTSTFAGAGDGLGLTGGYSSPSIVLDLHACLILMQRSVEGLHVGGKSALDWYGVRQYLSQQSILHLYGWTTVRLPGWFTERFPAEYHRKRLFDEPPADPLHAGPFEKRDDAPRVSTPERTLLEVLSEVGVRQPLQEARELAESAYSLRADVLRDLLQRCTSVKTVRLCLHLGRELALPWATKLDAAKLPTGSGRAWVSRSADGLLVLKP
ncbi:MAG: type IV toxin-antitoxin system AbiEi family antitoxin domain-containing protein [Polaromonas sp.]|nr:type IV toxin-antitoxin system AbiEi family antitoxin domain-containing protein [Polaromonas sp.]